MKSALPPCLGFGPGSFAAFTLRERLPRIVEDIMNTPGHSELACARLAALRSSLPDGAVPEAIGHESGDREFWRSYSKARRGTAWRELPFLEAEILFYRAILDAVGHDHCPSRDPFAQAKRNAVDKARGKLEQAALQARALQGWSYEHLECATDWSLTGNRADLSQLRSYGLRQARQAPLVNDLRCFYQKLSPDAFGCIDVVLDNVGEELLGDLVLISYLLSALPGLTIRAHAKPNPMFVSDVTPADWHEMIHTIRSDPKRSVAEWGDRLVRFEASQRLVVCTDAFWSRPLCLHEVGSPLREQLATSTALILKGDLNYRRYVQDRAWPRDSPREQHRIAELAPALTLRVLKSELVVGMSATTAARLDANEPGWLYNGKNSAIQFFV